MASQHSSILLAREPIFDRNMQVFGYQLQYSDGNRPKKFANQFDADKAAAQLIVNAFTSADEFAICEDRPTFIKVSSKLMLTGNLMSMPPTNVVLDISDDVEPDEQGLKILKHYRKHKFRLAIEVNRANYTSHHLLAFADFIRLDINALGIEVFRALLSHLSNTNQNAKLLASSVETQQQLRQCKKLEVELVQGLFLSRPAIVKGRDLSFSQSGSLQLVCELQSEDITPQRIAELLSQTPQLSYRLMRLINSATYELTRTIESLQEAVIYLGLDVICHWVSLMVLADSSGKPKALVMSTLIRAKMSESLCRKTNPSDTSRAFLIGLFSTLDAMLDIEMEKALANLPLSDEINLALLKCEGPLGGIAGSVIAYEQGRFEDAKQCLDVPDYQLFIAYGEAVVWANNVCSQLFN